MSKSYYLQNNTQSKRVNRTLIYQNEQFNAGNEKKNNYKKLSESMDCDRDNHKKRVYTSTWKDHVLPQFKQTAINISIDLNKLYQKTENGKGSNKFKQNTQKIKKYQKNNLRSSYLQTEATSSSQNYLKKQIEQTRKKSNYENDFDLIQKNKVLIQNKLLKEEVQYLRDKFGTYLLKKHKPHAKNLYQ